jgi:hypothetical protein
MPREKHILHAGAIAAAGALLLFAAGIPFVVDRDVLPRSLSRAVPLASWLQRLNPDSIPCDRPLGPPLVRAVHSRPEIAAEDLDVALRRFATLDATAGRAARTLQALTAPDGEVSPVASGSPASPLAVRRIERLGSLGETIQRVSAENASKLPLEFQAAVADCVVVTERVHRAMEEEIGLYLDAEELMGFVAALREEGGAEDQRERFGDDVRDARVAEFADLLVELADAFDRTRAALEMTIKADGLRELPTADGIPHDLVFASECAAGLVLIGGSNPTVLPLRGVAFAIDLGGDDVWSGDVGLGGEPGGDREIRHAAFTIDLDGDDRYVGDEHGVFGVIGGALLHVDLAGRDRYESASLGIGAAAFGAALVLDFAGDDRYVATRCGAGFGAAGIGALCDLDGDDVYRGEFAVLGAATAAGIGVLADLRGDDLYLTDLLPKNARAESSVGVATDLCGIGSAFALFVEVAGDDNYRLARNAAGVARDGGFAAAFDVGGDDRYGGAEWCFGTGVAGGVGVFRDFAGGDEYLARGNSLGYGRAGAGLFIDDSGRDTTMALDPARGAMEQGGFAIFADVDGLVSEASDSRVRRR